MKIIGTIALAISAVVTGQLIASDPSSTFATTQQTKISSLALIDDTAINRNAFQPKLSTPKGPTVTYVLGADGDGMVNSIMQRLARRMSSGRVQLSTSGNILAVTGDKRMQKRVLECLDIKNCSRSSGTLPLIDVVREAHREGKL